MRGNRKLKFIDRYLGIIFCFIAGNLSKVFYRGLSLFLCNKKGTVPTPVGYQARKILIIKLAALGDTVLLIPAIRSIKEKYKDCFISMVTTHINKKIIENCPYLNEVLEFPLREAIKNPFKIILFAIKLKSRKFDITIDFEQWSRISSILTYLVGSKERVGFKTNKQYRHYVYTKVVEHKRNRHEVECFLDIARVLNCPVDNKTLEIWIEKDDVNDVEKFLKMYGISEKERFVVFHPGCGETGFPREWDKDKYVELGKKIIKEFGVKIIITGDKNEINKADYIAGKIGENVINSAGITIDRKLAELFSRASLVVCSNTGAMHVASALKVPVVALHGPTDPEKWGPWQNENSFVIKKSLDCSPCLYLGFEYGCSSYNCMDLITVDDVFLAVCKLLRKCNL